MTNRKKMIFTPDLFRDGSSDFQTEIRRMLPSRARNIDAFVEDIPPRVVVFYDLEPRPQTLLSRRASRTSDTTPRWSRTMKGKP